MRTTLTLEDDVAREVDRLRREQKLTLKQAVNTLLRLGIAAMASRKRKRRAPYRIEPVDLGRCLLPNLDNIAEVLSVVEGDDHK